MKYTVIAVMFGWRAPAEYRGLSRESSRALQRWFEALGASVIVFPEG